MRKSERVRERQTDGRTDRQTIDIHTYRQIVRQKEISNEIEKCKK
jgi:hypothetical protein